MNSNSQQRYFNFHINAVGWINGIKWVDGEKPFFVVNFTALEGLAENPHYHWFSLVMTDAVSDMLSAYQGDVEQGAKIFASLRIANLEAMPFTHQQGERQGEIGVNLRGKIISIQSLSVDGQKMDLGFDDNQQGQNGYQGRQQGGRNNQRGRQQKGQQRGNQQGRQQYPGGQNGFQAGNQEQYPAAQQVPPMAAQGANDGYQEPRNGQNGYQGGASPQPRNGQNGYGYQGPAPQQPRGGQQQNGYQGRQQHQGGRHNQRQGASH